MNQKHLSYKSVTNQGSYYTPQILVNRLYEMLIKVTDSLSEYTIIDTSCGYGSFFDYRFPHKPGRLIGADIDQTAVSTAKNRYSNIEFCEANALENINRHKYNVSDSEKLIIVGNPPYNDITSKVRRSIKEGYIFQIDDDIRTRDLGISFLLSYLRLSPEYVCVLHPLSYMIKRSNYNLLRAFYGRYSLIDSLVINSQDFSETSKGTGFPIILAVYKKAIFGLSYDDVMSMDYRTIEGKTFNLRYDFISSYIRKYPNKNIKSNGDTPLFWTMRDINALKRNRTFIEKDCANAIVVDIDKLEYYCYVDVFKDFITRIPYYFGNCDVMIDNDEFQKRKEAFIAWSLEKHPFISRFFNGHKPSKNREAIIDYFEALLDRHYKHCEPSKNVRSSNTYAQPKPPKRYD